MVLREGLRNDWNAEVQQAWDVCYDALAQSMLEKTDWTGV